MSYLTRAFALCLLVGTLVVTATAQRLPQDGIEKSFDRFENKTSIHLTLVTRVDPYNTLALFLDGEYAGVPAPPDRLVLVVQAFGMLDHRKWGEACIVNLLVDGTQRYRFVLASPPDAQGQRTIEGAYHVNTVLGWVAYDDIRKIALGKRIEIRVEKTEFELSTAQTQTLRNFLKKFSME